MPEHIAPLSGDILTLEQEVEALIEESNRFKRVERNFANTDRDNVFVQADQYKLFMYTDGVVGRGEFANSRPEEDELLSLIAQKYDSPRNGYLWE